LLFFYADTFIGSSFGANKGKVVVVRDPLFDTLLAKRAMLNRGGGSSSGGGAYASNYGYRLQIYSGSNRNAAYAAQARFNREFPEMRTYISYHEPNFKVKAGDFRPPGSGEDESAIAVRLFGHVYHIRKN
jgi:hypothetical protein